MDKKCRQNSIKIFEYLDKKEQLAKRSLSYVDADLERHLEICPDCRQDYNATRQVFNSLANMPELEPPADFTVQILQKLPQGQKVKMPQWFLTAVALILLLPSGVIFGMVYNSFRFSHKLSFINTIFNSLLGKLLDFLEYLYLSFANVLGIVSGIAKALWALVMAYPFYFLSMLVVSVLVFTILARLIKDFQRENYA